MIISTFRFHHVALRDHLITTTAHPYKRAQSHGVKAYVGVADGEWYRFLASRPVPLSIPLSPTAPESCGSAARTCR